MTAAAIIQLALGLLQVVLGNLKSGTITDALQQAIAGIEAAIANLENVQGTPVTYDQLEALRIKPTW